MGTMQGGKLMRNSMLRSIISLAWPTMLEQFSQTVVQYADTAMVGTLGTAATAAVGATSTVSWLIGSTVSAISIGFLAFISQSWGAGKREYGKRASAQAFSVTFIVGLLFTIITTVLSSRIPVWMHVDVSITDMAARYFLILYSPMLFRTSTIILGTVLRSVGDTKTPMRVGIIVNIINVVLNFLFIYPSREIQVLGHKMQMFGLGLGVEGAAIASAVAFIYGGVAIAYAVWKHPEISPRGQSFRLDPEILKPCLKVTVPNMFQRFGTSFGYVVFASLINALGGTSTAAHTIANTVESAFYIPGWGMQTAAATLAGFAYGAGDREKLKKLGRTFLPLEIGLMVISGGLLFIFARPLVCLFTKDPEVIELGSTVLKMVAVSEPFYGVPIVVEGMMQGCGKTKIPLLFNLTGMWCVRILGTYICTRYMGLGLTSAWGCMIGHNLLLFFLFGFWFITGRWNTFDSMKRSS